MAENFYRRITCVVLLLIFISFPVFANNAEVSNDKCKNKTYTNWIGVKAPDLGPNAVDRNKGPRLKLDNYKGKRILLYSFDTGNFVNGPPKEEQKAIMRLLYKALDIRDKVGRNNFEIIGFTRGFGMFFLPPDNEIPEEEKEIIRIKDMFLVNTTREFLEPYDVLDEPGGIIIDRDGIIREIIPRAMTGEEIRRAAGVSSNGTIH